MFFVGHLMVPLTATSVVHPDGHICWEVLGNSYTLKADLWSLGVISYMLLTGCRERGEGVGVEILGTMFLGGHVQSPPSKKK